jgi:DNA polymerase II small subunit
MKKEILKLCMEKGFLLDKEMLELLSSLDEPTARKLIENLEGLKIQEKVITKTVFSKNLEKIRSVMVHEGNKTVIEQFFINFGYSRTELEPKGGVGTKQVELEKEGKVKILTAPNITPRKITVPDFVKHFRNRFEQIKAILQERSLDNLISLRKIGTKRDSYTVIVSILEKRVTKAKNLLFEVEDMTGRSVILVNQNKNELFDKAKDLLPDDIVAFQVSGSSEILFANDVIFPDAFLHDKKKHSREELVAFSSDLHIGSKHFLEKNFLKFIKWVNGEEGSDEQKELAKKVKYLFLTGDSVDGVGVFPTQEKLLNILDMEGQYAKLVEYLKLIRNDIQIIICPGQHDAVWVGSPQPAIGEDWAPGLYEMENVTLVPNPSLIEIDGGFKILMFHGASFAPFINNMESLRMADGFSTPTKVTKEILKRRHLSPLHGSMDYIPSEKKDFLVIGQVPDIVATADLHRSEVSTYNNILLISSSCWQSTTPFEEKVGNHPDPGKVPVFNLKTREIKILDFSDGDEEVEEKTCKEEAKEVVCEVKKEEKE